MKTTNQPKVTAKYTTESLKQLKRLLQSLDSTTRQCILDELTARNQHKQTTTVVGYMNQLIEELNNRKRYGTASNYRRALHSITTFLQGGDIPLFLFDENFVTRYNNWLETRNILRNSISFYNRIWRAVYNKAVKARLVAQTYPFQNVYTGIDQTRKRAISEDAIMKLVQLDLRDQPSLMLSRDLFLFSYCTRGMAFIDIAFLRKQNIKNGMLSYYRQKTGQRIEIYLEPCISTLIKRYSVRTINSPYLFPILTTENPETAFHQYQSALGYHNRKLKELGKQIGEELPLSTYTARHTWVTAARDHHIPLSVISAGMGHTSEKTTMIYLASLENSVIDQANREVIGKINQYVSF